MPANFGEVIPDPCRQCGGTLECPNCSVSLTVHRARAGWKARCHYCNYSMSVPKACANCAGPYLEQIVLLVDERAKLKETAERIRAAVA